jgi:integrase
MIFHGHRQALAPKNQGIFREMNNPVTTKSAKGSVGVESLQGRLRLRLPRQLFAGKQKYLSLGLADTVLNRKAATAKAKLIESDIALERFDLTLAKYSYQQAQTPTSSPEIDRIKSLKIIELWQQYFENKRSGLKSKTVEKYENFTSLFSKLGDLTVADTLAVHRKLESVTTLDRTKDGLMYLSAACKWGLKHGLVAANFFEGMANELPQHRYQTDPNPNAFTEMERDKVLAAFKGDNRKGKNYRHYSAFVAFLFGVGCRPSEAIGLRWQHISEDCQFVDFVGSIVQVRNQRVYSDKSKNNRTRRIAVSLGIQSLLATLKTEDCCPDALVFPGPEGDAINYRNFSRRAWHTLVDPIKPKTTPYSCRDTFITLQLLKGVPSTVIAKWCDTSTQIIDKNYVDKLHLTQLRPLE